MGENTQNTAGTPHPSPRPLCVGFRDGSGHAIRAAWYRPMITLEPAPKMLRESGSYFRASSEGTADNPAWHGLWAMSSIVRKRPGRIITCMFKRFTVIILTVAALSALSACSGDADVRMGPASDVRVEAVR